MAEIFGIAASGMGVASLALQLASALKELRAFCESAKNAPDDLRELVDEIQHLSSLLNQLDHDSRGTVEDLASQDMAKCIATCRRGVKSIVEVAQGLQREFTSRKRLRAAIRYYFNDDRLRDLTIKLERGKSSLMFAHQLYMASKARDHFNALYQQQQMSAGESRADQENSRQSTTPTSIGCAQKAVRRRRKGQDLGYDHGLKRSFVVETPAWLGYQVWRLAFEQATRGWTFSMTPLDIVQWNSDVVRACGNGDLAAMRRYFSIGQVTPFAQTPSGISLLEWALSKGHVHFFEFYLEQRLYRDGLLSKLPYAPWSILERSSSKAHCPESLIRLGQLCIEHDDDSHDIYKTMTEHPELAPINEFRPHRFPTLLTYKIIVSNDAELIRLACILNHLEWHEPSNAFSKFGMDFENGCKFIEESIRSQRFDLFAILASNFAWCWKSKHNNDYYPWRILARHMLRNRSSRESGSIYCGTTIRLICDRMRNKGIKPGLEEETSVQKMVTMWVRILQDEGVDLETFGKSEAAAVNDAKPKVRNSSLRVLRMTYGSKASDFRLWFEHSGDQYAGDFWDMLEHPERKLPGAWL